MAEVEDLKGSVEAGFELFEFASVGGRCDGIIGGGGGGAGEFFDGLAADFVGLGAEVGDDCALVDYFAARVFDLEFVGRVQYISRWKKGVSHELEIKKNSGCIPLSVSPLADCFWRTNLFGGLFDSTALDTLVLGLELVGTPSDCQDKGRRIHDRTTSARP